MSSPGESFNPPPVPAAPLEYAGAVSSTAPIEYARRSDRLPYQPVALVVFLHIATASLFSVFWFNSLHDWLPKTKPDDPSASKAIALLFVPGFNFYWVFFTWLRLCDRLAEQRALLGLPPSGTKALCLVACILLFIPIVNLISLVTIQPALFACMQAEVNELHFMGLAPVQTSVIR